MSRIPDPCSAGARSERNAIDFGSMFRSYAYACALLLVACTSPAGGGSGGGGGGRNEDGGAGQSGGADAGGSTAAGGRTGGSGGVDGVGGAGATGGWPPSGGVGGHQSGGRGGSGGSGGAAAAAGQDGGGAPGGLGGNGGTGDGHGGAGTPIAVAVGYGRRRVSSVDGSHWTLIEKTPNGGDDNDLFRGVTYGNGRFVAVGGSTVSLTQISTDGMNWIDGGTGTAWLGGVAWNGTVFVAAGGNGLRLRSTDNGATWTNPAGSQAKHYRAVAFGAGQVVAVGHTYDKSGPNNTDVGVIVSTADGLQWTERRAAGETFGSIAYGNGIFVASTDGTTVATSTDGITWVDQVVGTGSGGICFTGSEFVLWRNSGTYRSSNGTVWTQVTPSGRSIAGFFNGLYVSFDWPLRVNTSSDLLTWKRVFEPLGSCMSQMVVGFAP